VLFGVATAGVIVDQITKALALSHLREGSTTPVIGGILHWTLQRNPGAAFSLFTRFPIVFTVIAFVIATSIVVSVRRVPDRFYGVALGLVLAGALGNLADRIARPPGVFRGHVIDFIDFRIWPVFNIADSCIVVGAGLLIIASWRSDRRSKDAPADG